jgi:hypothetical protein
MMAFTTVFEDVVFVEGDHHGAVRGPKAKSDLTYSFGAQLKSIRDIKHNLANQAKKKSFNAVLDFKYGQKSKFFALDNVGYWGEGVLANIPQREYSELCSKADQQ